MPKPSAARRVRIERNIYRTGSGAYEVGFRDGTGKQRWRSVQGGITAARAVQDELLARRGRGERSRSERTASPCRRRRAVAGESGRRSASQDPGMLPQRRRASSSSRFGSRRLEAVSPDDLAVLVRDLRDAGLSESTIVIVLGVANRLYRFAAHRLGWAGMNPVCSLMRPL